MLIKKSKEEQDTYITCARCGAHLCMSGGGKCSCGEIEISKPDEAGVQMIVGDSDDLVIENE